jgi:hypothetical protein
MGHNYDTSRYHDINILPGHFYLLGKPFVVPVYQQGPAYYGMIDPPRCGVPNNYDTPRYQVTRIYYYATIKCMYVG